MLHNEEHLKLIQWDNIGGRDKDKATECRALEINTAGRRT